MAYCLIGIFDVNLSLMYGEGAKRAFERLQKTILERYDDESIFTFTPRDRRDDVLASSPREFADCGDVVRLKRHRRLAFYLTNRGLQFNSAAIDVGGDFGSGRRHRRYAVELKCARVARDHARPRPCTLGLRRKESRFIRDTTIEEVFDCMSEAGREVKLRRGRWQWNSVKTFYIHISKSGRSRHRRDEVDGAERSSGRFSRATGWHAVGRMFRRILFGQGSQRQDRDMPEERTRSGRSAYPSGASRGRQGSRRYSVSLIVETGYGTNERTSNEHGRERSHRPSRAPRSRPRQDERHISRGGNHRNHDRRPRGFVNVLPRPQWLESNDRCDACGQVIPSPREFQRRQSGHESRCPRSRHRSGQSRRRGDSGYDSTSYRMNATSNRDYGDSDSGLGSEMW